MRRPRRQRMLDAAGRQHDMIARQFTDLQQGHPARWAYAPVSDFVPAGVQFCDGEHAINVMCDEAYERRTR